MHGSDTSASIDSLQSRLGYRFVDVSHLELALRHRSWCSENGGVDSNERLEFLGDSVLGLVVTDQLYNRAPECSEGVLARNRSEVVSSVALGTLARSMDLGASLRLGKGEKATGGREKTSILADALEAVFGAVYIDGGMTAAEPVVLTIVGDLLDAVLEGNLTSDFKSQLQERAARDFASLPEYRVADEGPEHKKHFAATVMVDGAVRGSGEGRTKKAAEQAAAKAALDSLESGREPVRSAQVGSAAVVDPARSDTVGDVGTAQDRTVEKDNG